MRVFATGFEDYIEEDRPALYASFGGGNTDHLEVYLQFVDNSAEDASAGAYFRVSDLQAIVNAAIHGEGA